MMFHWRGTKTVVLCLLLAAVVAACAPSYEDQGPLVVDAGEMETFADDFFTQQMAELDIPGLTFVLVHDGEVVLAKGYGSASLEKGIPVDPEETVMRIGSVSKLFVATAVMQLVERGELDLRADVNQYLSAFQIDDAYAEPVTLAHLLTHTAGFEAPPYSTTTDPAQVPPLGPYLAEHMPPQIGPPGETFRYSNHGYALAAYVVEEVSGLSFDEYVQQNILHPLGMERSGYLLGPPMPEGLATGYFYENGEQLPQPVDYDADYPGGSMVSTATDMAKFMLAFLQDGRYEDTFILQPETIEEMHQRHFTVTPGKSGVTYGFAEGFVNGQRLLGHSGAITGFSTILDLLPEHDLGYFFSFNEEYYQTSAGEIIPSFRQQFMDHLFPPAPRIPLLGNLERPSPSNLSHKPTRTPPEPRSPAAARYALVCIDMEVGPSARQRDSTGKDTYQ
jgi:CubicO group peptidase (beta-lactamase class C family)